jgi:mono/diheme cytochrome c family protein
MKAVILCAVLCVAAPTSLAAGDPATTFARVCAACHTYGKGTLIGPDLKGVTSRRTRAWLSVWIASPESLLRSGDAAAAELFSRFKPQRMPDQSMSTADISAMVDYLAADGPEADVLKHRAITTATPAEIELGRSLFVGQRALVGGDAPCSACHRAGDSVRLGGTLGPDLAAAYARHQDKSMAAALARECIPRARPAPGAPALTAQEAFAIRAFLRQTTGATLMTRASR